jgi:hypothetical protein
MTVATVHALPRHAVRTHTMQQSLDSRIAQALDCPCVQNLKQGPCGELFVTTFTCFHKSRAEPKGCDCLDVSLAFAVSRGGQWEQEGGGGGGGAVRRMPLRQRGGGGGGG